MQTLIPTRFVALSDEIERTGKRLQGADWDRSRRENRMAAFQELRRELYGTPPDHRDARPYYVLGDDGEVSEANPPQIWGDHKIALMAFDHDRVEFWPGKYGYRWVPTAAPLKGQVILPDPEHVQNREKPKSENELDRQKDAELALATRDTIELDRLIQIASSDYRWPPQGVWKEQFRELKAEIEEKNLPATRATPFATTGTLARLDNLWVFAHKDKKWIWLIELCRRWASARGRDLPDPNQQKPQIDKSPYPNAKRYKKPQSCKLLPEWLEPAGRSNRYNYRRMSGMLDIWKSDPGPEYLFVKLGSKAKIVERLKVHCARNNISVPVDSQLRDFVTAWLVANAPEWYWNEE